MKILIILAFLVLLAGCGGSSSGSSSYRAQTSGGQDSDVVNSIAEMSVGDLYYINFDGNGDATATFTGAQSGAKYTLIVQATETTSSSVSLTSTEIAVDPADAFDKMLRLQESRFADKQMSPAKSAIPSYSAAKTVGDGSSFRVLSSLSSSTSYTTVTATSKCEKDHIKFYVDNSLASDALSSTDIETLCGQFEYAVGIETAALGETSDVNGDGKVTILLTPAVNRLGASGGGIITGYFYSADLYSRTSSNPTSNQMEIVYVLAPDPGGLYGTTISKEFAMSNLLPAVVPHEVQHAINYNMHVLVNGGSSEKSWLNEGLSHFAEDLTGFNVENPSRVEMFLQVPESVSLTPASSPDLYERGASYLFMRFLYERSATPDAFLSALYNTDLTGTDNIEAAFGTADVNFDEWPEFMRRWAIAIALTDSGVSSTAQYQFNSRTVNSTTGNYQGVCLICDTDDNRGTILNGPYMEALSTGTLSVTLYGTATAYYSLSSPPSSISIDGNSSAGLQGMLIRTE